MFQELLTKIADRLPNTRACVLLDQSAIALAEVYRGDDTEAVQALSVELATLIWTLRRREVLTEDIGTIQEMFLRTDRLMALCRVIAGEYLLLVAIDSTQNKDQGEAMLRAVSPWLDQQL